MEKALKFENLVKEFPGFKLGPLNFKIEPGKVVAYVGPNGSGKTTTMQTVMGLLKADEGCVKIFGAENNQYKIDWKLNIGYVGDIHAYFENWSVSQNFNFLKQFYPNWDNKKAALLARRLDLEPAKLVGNLSRGNRIKLSIIQALAHNPKLLIFDEPTDGLDPVVRNEFMDILFEEMEKGERSIFYSTHLVSEVERICDELIFLNEGNILLQTEKEDLLDSWRTISFTSDRSDLELPGMFSLKKENGKYKLVSKECINTLAALKQLGITDVIEKRLSLEEISVNILKEVKNVQAD